MLGETLKNTRLSKGLTLEKAASDLRIKISSLKALEEEDFEKFPAEVYTMGYIRSYALYLGLDPEPLIKEFKNRTNTLNPDAKDSEGETLSVSSSTIQQSAPSFMAFLLKPPAIISIVIILVSGIIIFSIFKATKTNTKLDIPLPPEVSSKEAPSTKSRGTDMSVMQEKDEPESPFSASAPEKREQKISNVQSSTTATEAEKKYPNTLKIVATELTWLRIDTSEGSYDITMKPNEVVQYKSEKDFKLLIGNAGGIRLILNDKDLGLPGKSGEVKILTLP